MGSLDLRKLKEFRQKTFRLDARERVKNPEDALGFINERGYVFFWPITGYTFPSLWTAVAGDRPVASEHDDPGHTTWGWKDDSLAKRIWYYAKVIRRKATFISLTELPFFYALSENYGSPEEDHLIAYREGRLTLAAKQIYDALLEKGALTTLDLRRESRLMNAKETVFNRALEDLQRDFKVLPVGIAEAGAWRYSYIYELTYRFHPDLMEKARCISEAEARQELMRSYFASLGACGEKDVVKFFQWSKWLVQRTVEKLIEGGGLIEVCHPTASERWLSLPELSG